VNAGGFAQSDDQECGGREELAYKNSYTVSRQATDLTHLGEHPISTLYQALPPSSSLGFLSGSGSLLNLTHIYCIQRKPSQ